MKEPSTSGVESGNLRRICMDTRATSRERERKPHVATGRHADMPRMHSGGYTDAGSSAPEHNP